MKKMKLLFYTITFLIFNTTVSINAQAQRSPFRSGYLRLGFNKLGSKMDNAQSGLENVSNGNLGAKMGYALDFGHIYYFNKESDFPVKFGLDWTFISLNYNKLDWSDYVAHKGDPDAYIEGTKMALSAGTKAGLNLSFNPVEDVIIDTRAQLAWSWYFFDQDYYAHEGAENESYFSFTNNQDENVDGESIKQRIRSAFNPSFGITIRRKAIGLSLDYMPAKVDYYYQSSESSGKAKFKVPSLQFKLSLTL